MVLLVVDVKGTTVVTKGIKNGDYVTVNFINCGIVETLKILENQEGCTPYCYTIRTSWLPADRNGVINIDSQTVVKVEPIIQNFLSVGDHRDLGYIPRKSRKSKNTASLGAVQNRMIPVVMFGVLRFSIRVRIVNGTKVDLITPPSVGLEYSCDISELGDLLNTVRESTKNPKAGFADYPLFPRFYWRKPGRKERLDDVLSTISELAYEYVKQCVEEDDDDFS